MDSTKSFQYCTSVLKSIAKQTNCTTLQLIGVGTGCGKYFRILCSGYTKTMRNGGGEEQSDSPSAVADL